MADNTTLPGTGDVIATDDISGVKYQRVKAVWGTDGVATDVEATAPLPTSINASIFRFSANNTSVVQLAAGATFTGSVETALDQPSISLLLASDQPITLTIKQYIDAGAARAVPDIVYYIPANQGLSASFALNGNYINVTAKNTGTATSTTFSLNTAYGTLPSSDGTGRLPVSKADCVQLLNQTITVAGYSTTIDTNGFGAVVCQISGIWQGASYFEASNDGLAWDGVLTFSRDNLSLQDILTSSGLYTVRPSGRYLRLNVTSVTGSMVLTTLGRAAEGIAASDLLSLAMDRTNNTPMYVSLLGTKQDVSGALVLADAGGPYLAAATTASSSIGILTINTTGYASITDTGVSGAATMAGYFSDNGSTWMQVSANVMQNGGQTIVSATPGFTSAAPVVAHYPCVGKYFQLRFTAITTGPAVASVTLRQAPCVPLTGMLAGNAGISVAAISAGTAAIGDLGVQYRGSATGAATISKFTAAASTNAASVKPSAGRVVGWYLVNTTAAIKVFRFFNKASAPTVGTDVPAFNVYIPANGVAMYEQEGGVGFATGIAIACTGAIADLDTTATAANDVLGAIFYA